ncbi:MAG: sugar phosphate isomerase/epimerase [Opitutales bacterium]|nr:sugar phosphate isomerase/epimerase [Opitutales bacterium]
MNAAPLTDFSRLCVHTISTKGWELEEAVDRYAKAGVSGITVWRQWLEGRDPVKAGESIRATGLEVVSLCRGGFYPASEQKSRDEAIEDNKKAIEDAAALGAPLVVLVCGAVPGQSLVESRKQITDGIAATLPLAESLGIKLAIEPLHPMYADDRSAINSLASANQVCDELNHPLVGIAYDVYHLWWDPDLEEQTQRTVETNRLFAYHVCDWMTPTTDLLNDRGLMGEGCIDLRGIRAMVEKNGFNGMIEVEVFSNRWWEKPTDEFLQAILHAYLQHT